MEPDDARQELALLDRDRPYEILLARRHALEPRELLRRRRRVPAEQVARDLGVREPAGEGGEIFEGRRPEPDAIVGEDGSQHVRSR